MRDLRQEACMVAGIQCYRKEGQGKARRFLHDYDAGKNCVGRVKELPTEGGLYQSRSG